jgi:MFS transporter, FSR family, fosmidomycin resistance protein
VLAVENIFGLAGGLLPWGIGIIAHRAGLPVAMWLLCLGPLALLIGIPRRADAS